MNPIEYGKMATRSPALMATVAFAFIIAAMLIPFYKKGSEKYTVIGIQGDGSQGCLGSCVTENNNCMGDDAPSDQCRAVQAFFILAALFSGLSLPAFLVDIRLLSTSPKLVSEVSSLVSNLAFGTTVNTLAFGSLLIALILATCLPDGLSPYGALVDIETNKEIEYDVGFGLSVAAVILLFITTFIGSNALNKILPA